MKKISLSKAIIPLISLTVFFLLSLLSMIPFIEKITDTVNDIFTYKILYSSNLHNENIVIVKVDDATLNAFGKSDIAMLALDKGVYADTLKNIFEIYKADVVGIDIILANPSVLGKQDEEKLADVLGKYKDKVVLASRSDTSIYPLCLYSGVQHGAVEAISQSKMRTFPILPFSYNLHQLCPEETLSAGNEKEISFFSQEVLELYLKHINPFAQQNLQKNLDVFKNLTKDTAYIDYYSDGKSHEGTFGYESYSLIDIYKGLQVTKEGKTIDLSGKIILIGEVATALHDSHFTPVFQNIKMSGVEIHANVITTLQNARVLQELPFLGVFLLFFLLQSCIVTSVIYLRTLWALTLLLGVSLIIIVVGMMLFEVGYIFNILGAIVGLFFSFFVAYIYRFQVTDRAKRLLKKQFSLYVSSDVVDSISQNPQSIMTQGEKRELSIFFSDIVGFTSISESLNPEKMVEILNEYFSEMTKIIHTNKGTLDKYIGDSIMCFFNAPLKQENHSFYACKTALQQQKKLKELNLIWQKRGYPEIKIRIGLHTGEAVHGNIGSTDTRVSYTIIGDSVNLASRLEAICKEYAVSICVSQSIYELQKDVFYFRELDTLRVKGKNQAITIYQLLGSKTQALPDTYSGYFQNYALGLKYYRAEDFQKAYEIWSHNTKDPSSVCMAQRCKDILEGKAYFSQGVFTMTHK